MLYSYLERILKARVYEIAKETPLESMGRLSGRLQNAVLLKREDLQPVFSFKLRGAHNKLLQLSEEARQRGVIAASAGNHAQGVALSARKLGISARIVMPRTTPPIKIEAVRDLGAEIDLVGNTYDEAYQYALALAEKQVCTFIHPYDDPEVIAGQGTVAMEILRQYPEPLHAIFVPVGGGGLIAGVAAYVKALSPEIRVIGVEPDDASSLYQALQVGERVVLDQVGIFADGAAVRQVGKEPFRIAREAVDEVLLVDSDAICAAIMDIFEDTRSIAEPAGALAVAGLKQYVEREGLRGQSLVAIDSGANINFDRLRHVAERAELGERREALFCVTIPEQRGSFLAFCEAIGKRGITEFNYRYGDSGEAHVFVGIQTRNGSHVKDQLLHDLHQKGYSVVDMSDNEMAKLHVRYMVGGQASKLKDEVLYRFEFPERPGALLRFLTHMGSRWNISLFHYRNHGAAYGRVLAGIQVPPAEKIEFQIFLDELAYTCQEETDNPAYRLFLGPPSAS
ncbi:L-threonine ammonia-lyase [Nitrosococcus oceani ATCC 19707]|uniref:L-threonine dehydratase n=2 Tax=Nitrosococcus oceani TaxID=1229 RepID=Q3J7S7_NITOC|nr:threonine ammonia-lyase, biosynthetic [Nitrosococcus oceani]ABA59119.1 L-threonine ammonia-lyase [Nitrosococcus oceani ATCC 19707]EDZ65772.1 threonine ammonia-lyase, biosynthetic [Nitrosococcus oceani AFC27]KFI18441.1 threonine dehydratase [Nitrosococcus oceani C-27]GEM20351.1 PLP-dependent threonine dehydratase [Nitrosococcus oceani]